MRLRAWLVGFCLLAGAALAQTPGSFVGTSTNPTAAPLSAASLNAAFGRKVDTTNGVLTNPTINGGAVNAATGAFSGALSAAGAVSGAGFTALLSPYALASSDALKLPLAGGTLTGPLVGTSGTFSGAINAGSLAINGALLVPLGTIPGGGANTTIFAGVNTGLNLGSASNFSTFYGSSSGAAYNDTGSGEVSGFGVGSCSSLVLPAIHDTCLGVYTLHYETTGQQDVAVGGDTMRNTALVSAGTAIGSRAHQDYRGQKSFAGGAFALYGNAASILIGGTATAADVITLTFTSTAISGGSVAIPYTVSGGDTPATITAALSAAANGSAPLIAADIRVGGDITASPNVIPIVGPNAAAAGPAPLVVTAAIAGAATETVTITGGSDSASTRNNATGFDSMMGLRITTSSFNNAYGAYTLANLTTGSHNNCYGDSACQFGTTLATTSAFGDSAFKAATTANSLVGMGNNVGALCTTCRNVTLLGNNAGQTTLTTGNDIIIISDGSACDTNSPNRLMMCGSGGTFLQFTGTNTAASSIGYVPGGFLVGSTTVTTNVGNAEIGIKEATLSGVAPGAGIGKLAVAAGTSVGTCKLVFYGGSTATPVTVLDNVGSGC
jgi:hypothetical protein